MDTAKVPPLLYTRKKPNKIAYSDYRIIPPYDKKPQPKDIRVAEDFTDIKVLENFTEKAIAWIDKVHEDDKTLFSVFSHDVSPQAGYSSGALSR